ncbi:hypothetical protein CERZMDRAFT_87406 [Cercospora zeae-maydis SCOH1-5]|uniref:Uncharacterized protein n=1 Tax=Cercospora zeae-maydis SCOH1-5 TaxID=717836 RepID=A0A6A6F5W5_9PEZI|nr:hypothetical protein CERZMDRAFT_87406 [Cercospora zeae-maydis SCOH1-5]
MYMYLNVLGACFPARQICCVRVTFEPTAPYRESRDRNANCGVGATLSTHAVPMQSQHFSEHRCLGQGRRRYNDSRLTQSRVVEQAEAGSGCWSKWRATEASNQGREQLDAATARTKESCHGPSSKLQFLCAAMYCRIVDTARAHAIQLGIAGGLPACMTSSPNGPGAGGPLRKFQIVPTNPRERWRLAVLERLSARRARPTPSIPSSSPWCSCTERTPPLASLPVRRFARRTVAHERNLDGQHSPEHSTRTLLVYHRTHGLCRTSNHSTRDPYRTHRWRWPSARRGTARTDGRAGPAEHNTGRTGRHIHVCESRPICGLHVAPSTSCCAGTLIGGSALPTSRGAVACIVHDRPGKLRVSRRLAPTACKQKVIRIISASKNLVPNPFTLRGRKRWR